MPDTPETVIALDFGLRRIGVAVGQQVTRTARPLAVVANGETGPDWQHIESIFREWRPDRIIVGMPAHADGTAAEIGAVVARFIDDLQRFALPVETVDERYSSVDAEAMLASQRARGRRGRISKELIDSVAAAVIAERWLKKEF